MLVGIGIGKTIEGKEMKMLNPPLYLFDLDGTLIDSAPAILASFREAFAQTGIAPVRSIDESMIGTDVKPLLIYADQPKVSGAN